MKITPAHQPLNVLIVEDNEDDMALILSALKHGGYDLKHRRVETAQTLKDAIAEERWDVVLIDCHLPNFSGVQAIAIIRATPDMDFPVIIVSGTIGEETAVEMIKAGAQDYVHKDNLTRLSLTINRETNAAKTRVEKIASEAQRVLDRENFINIVAHDLRAPVQRIETMVQLLREDYGPVLDDDGRDIVFRIERSAGRLRLMLASLMAYSRHGRTSTKGKIASLPGTIDEALENVGIDRTSANITISLGAVDWLKGDNILIGHVIQNIVSNAFKFRRDDRQFNITFEAALIDGGRVQVSISDNGIGIEPRFADKVFEIFYRLHDEDEFEGTGIGLAICRKIIGDHDGTIWVDIGYTGGTRICFTLEAADFVIIEPRADVVDAMSLN